MTLSSPSVYVSINPPVVYVYFWTTEAGLPSGALGSVMVRVKTFPLSSNS